MVTEIGVRNFIDDYRYNLLEKVADAFEFDTLKNKGCSWIYNATDF
jgi:nitric-oxide synthase